jgi:group II intron reverse transcriptase/maturase/CRISPR-associated endonuclease Cas1
MSSSLFQTLCLPATLYSAWERVKSKKSAGGIDGLSVLAFEENLEQNLQELLEELKMQTWNPEPYLRIEIKKNETEKRKLGLLSVKDKIVQQAIKMLIEPLFEKQFLGNSYGYRPGRGHTKAIRKALHEVSQKQNEWVAQLDIDNYFDTINHEILFSRLQTLISDPEIIRLIELSIKMGIVSKRLKWTEITEGVPQGAVLSPLLANLYLHPFDRFVTDKTASYIRYADDFLIFAKTKEQIDEWVTLASDFLQTRLKLKLNKPLVCNLDRGIEFLGLVINKTGISLSGEKKLKLQKDIQSIKWVKGCFTEKSIETLSGIERYYAQLLPQELLIPLDEMLKVKIASLITSSYKSIPNRKVLSETLKQTPFFSNSIRLSRKQLINDCLTLYSAKKNTGVDIDKNKKLINQKKKEYQKREAEGSELIVSSFGSFIGKSNQGITVKVNGKLVRKAPSQALEHITITTHGVSISSDAIHYCAENRIPIDFFNYTECYASVLSPVFIAQSLWQKQTDMSLKNKVYLASRILYGKLKNQLHLVKYFHKYHKTDNAPLEQCYNKTATCLEELIEKVKKFLSENVDYAKELIAYEASGAVSYWEYIRLLLADDEVDFENRERRGATDLFNCLLNYGYAVLYSRIWQAVLSAKLNPSVGVLHAYQPGKPTFAYDIIEMFRTQAVDRVIISLVQKSEPLDMDKNLLNKDTRDLLVKNIVERLNRYEKYRSEEIRFVDIIERQTREIASYISGESKTFKPYVAKW